MLKKPLLYIVLQSIICCLCGTVFAQAQENMLRIPDAQAGDSQQSDYQQLMQGEYYEDAVKQIESQIDEYTGTHVADKEVPASFITFSALEEKQNLNVLFSKRQVPIKYIEENAKMRQLHYDAGLCREKMGDHLKALSHYNQSFMFKKIVPQEDAAVFYRMAQVYRTMGYTQAYLNELEIAHYLKQDEEDYIKELGEGYYTSKVPKMAILYFEKYAQNKGESFEDYGVYLKLANLNTSIGNYLETEKYYLLYLDRQPDDLDALYALGVLSYTNTGHFDLALERFESIKKRSRDLPQDKVAKINELSGDIHFKREKYNRAIDAYLSAIENEQEYRKQVESKRSELEQLEIKINELKAELIKKNDYVKYEQYQDMNQDKTRLAYELMMMEYELRKYNPGKLRWQTAECYERIKNYEKSLEYYRQCIAENHRQNEARARITKIQLILQRGY